MEKLILGEYKLELTQSMQRGIRYTSSMTTTGQEKVICLLLALVAQNISLFDIYREYPEE